MTHPLNLKRADRARRTLDKSDYESGPGFVDGFVDFLSDMMHCIEQQTGEDFDDLVRRAREHYQVEAFQPDDIEMDSRRMHDAGIN